MEEVSRDAVLSMAKQFFAKQPVAPFVPGKTYIPVTGKTLTAEDLGALIDGALDLWLTSGRFTREFERRLADLFQRRAPALFVNSGSSANLLAASALGSPLLKEYDLRPLEKGDEVITAAVGFPTTVSPILQNGWIPAFVDTDLRTLNPTVDQIKAAYSPKVRAVMLAHTLGNPFEAEALSRWCAEKGLYLIEDCCDALGGSIGEVPVGRFGEFATLSFYPAHHITTGEGGAVIAKDSRWRRVAESIRDWGRHCWCETGVDNTCGKRFGWNFDSLPAGYDHKYVYAQLGYNLKATDLQAALGCSQIAKLESFVSARRTNWERLHAGITGSPLLREFLTPVTATPGTNPSWFGFALHCHPRISRSALTRFLEEKKIGTRLVFAGNLLRQPAFREVPHRISRELKNADLILHSTFWVGVHPGIDASKVNYMLECLEQGIRIQVNS